MRRGRQPGESREEQRCGVYGCGGEVGCGQRAGLLHVPATFPVRILPFRLACFGPESKIRSVYPVMLLGNTKLPKYIAFSDAFDTMDSSP